LWTKFHESEHGWPSDKTGNRAGGCLAIRVAQLRRGVMPPQILSELRYLAFSILATEQLYNIMASFTRIEESEGPSITVHPSHRIAKINDNIYGGFTE
jgi:hypothetical protein